MSSPVPLLGCRSIIDVLRHMTEDGPEWAHRYVTLWFQNPPNAWVLMYPLQDTTEAYFDFMYTGAEPCRRCWPSTLNVTSSIGRPDAWHASAPLRQTLRHWRRLSRILRKRRGVSAAH
jgi:hypothetical protein